MASAAPAERFHIVLAPAEKRRWATNAAAAGLPTSEYVRRAVEAYEDEERLTPEQMRELEGLVAEAVAAAEQIRADVAEIHEIVSRPLDDETPFAEGFAAAQASGFKLEWLRPRGEQAA